MKKKIWFLFVVSVFLVSCSSDDNTVVDPVLQDDDIVERLQTIIDEKVGTDTDKLVGVSVSIRVDGEERWQLTGGLSKLNVPTTSNMRFGIASITKTVVAATTLKLEEEGLLSLEDPISDYLTLNSPNVDESATIFQLLSHWTGINGYFTTDLWDVVEGNLDTPLTPLEVSQYILEPTNAPGVTHEYSNSNYLLLGMIIEEVTGQTVGEVMRERFWTPLQLNNVYFGANENIQGTIATPWRDGDGNGTLEDISDEYRAAYHSVFYCAADVFTTASDLSMWAKHLYGGNALTEVSRQKMMTSYFDYGHPIFLGYGLGVRKNVYAGRTMWGHTGGMRGYGSHMFYDPISKVSIAVLNNQSRSEDGPALRQELIDELLAEVFNEL